MNKNKEIEKIRKKIDRYDIISFDLYDTLVFRQVAKPTDIFALVMREYQKTKVKQGITDSDRKNEKTDSIVKDFKQKRSEAELRLYKSGKTFSLSDIYEELKGYNTEEKAELQEIEARLETELCFPGKYGKQLYDLAVEKKKKIIITTDMYLPEKVIRGILRKCGYTGIDKIYISSQIGKWKSRYGELFQYVKDDIIAEGNGNNFRKARILQIGDNYRNDVVFARLHGIDTVYLANKRDMAVFGQAWVKECSEKSNTAGGSIKDSCYSMGYDIFGPLILGYTSWIHDISVREGKEKILFFAREGYCLKKVYDLMYVDIPSDYVCVSRKALKCPLMGRLNTIEEVFNAFYVNKVTTYEKLLGNLGLSGNGEVWQLLEKYGISLKDTVIGAENDKKVSDRGAENQKKECSRGSENDERKYDGASENDEKKYDRGSENDKEKYDREGLSQSLLNIIHKRSKEQYANVCKYLDKILKGNEKRISIVDIGWTGSMQNAFETLVKEHRGVVDVTGFFLIQMIEIKKYIENGMKNHAYLCGYKDGEDAEILRTATSILESVFSADHASTAGYNSEGEPVFDEETLSEKTKTIVHDIQQGMFDYCKEYAALRKQMGYIDRKYLRSRSLELFGNPPEEMLDIAKDIEIYDGKLCRLFTKASPLKPGQFVSEFKNAVWMNGFLKYNLKCRNSYPIYKWIRKIAQKNR